jgi:transposase
LFVALELSKSAWLVAIHSPPADEISEPRLAGGDVTALLSLIARKRGDAQVAPLRRVRVISCYEADYYGFWLHRLLCSQGIDNRVLAPEHSGRPAFSSEQKRTPGCGGLVANIDGACAPSVEQEEERCRSRERARLVSERGQH